MRIRSTVVAVSLAAVAASGLAFHETPADSIAADVTSDGTTVSFTGYANLTPKGAEDVFAKVTGFAQADVAAAAGIDLTGGTIEEYGDGEGCASRGA